MRDVLPITPIDYPNKIARVSRMETTQGEMRKVRGANLARLRKHQKLTLEKLAEMADTTAPTLSSIESGKKGLGPRLLVKLCNALKVKASEFDRAPYDVRQVPPPSGEIAVISMCQGGAEGHYEAPYPAGSGFRYIKRPYDVTDPGAYAVEVRGDSMSPRYEEGEMVIASPEKEVHGNDYVVVQLATGEIMIKRVKFREGLVILTSVNPSVEPWVYRPEDVIAIHKVVWKKEKS